MYQISIVIPTYNRPEKLKNCLQSLTKLDYNKNSFEVIVVDDGSPQSLESIISYFQPLINLKCIQQKNLGPATARNKGVSQAQGEYMAFTDDDCEVTPLWLSIFADGFAQNPDAILGGFIINKLKENIYSEASQKLVDYLYSYYNAIPEQSKFFTSNNFAISKIIFQKIGGFNTTFPLAAAEDRELCDRLYSQGYKMIYLPKAQVEHSHYLTLKTFWQQHINYGKGAKHFHYIKAKKDLQTIKIEPINFYFNLLIFPIKSDFEIKNIKIMILFILSQWANLIGFVSKF
ncbi:glycosyltransferase family 2 protein [Geminocystis sp. NIES-3709]|uniref:glycosyltransferase n=1 Tax=Geminocystis sp. NIES-3709 TaxID=1617448 RepID=UPI0005FCC364|nr:glycosyltransferase [Geminocystis sp. NIES-3709]BAQ64044.1 glycosyl transferase [Geminocystis sp. NIES-3709]